MTGGRAGGIPQPTARSGAACSLWPKRRVVQLPMAQAQQSEVPTEPASVAGVDVTTIIVTTRLRHVADRGVAAHHRSAQHADRPAGDQLWTASAGAAYTVNMDTSHPTRFSVDALVQSGLRASTATIPNGLALPTYGVVNLSIVQKLDTGVGRGTELRLDVLNVGDAVYQIRNGTGVGVGAPQFGLRRTILAGLTQRF
jgi:hypothetical protein